jgi:hypothetical protein
LVGVLAYCLGEYTLAAVKFPEKAAAVHFTDNPVSRELAYPSIFGVTKSRWLGPQLVKIDQTYGQRQGLCFADG